MFVKSQSLISFIPWIFLVEIMCVWDQTPTAQQNRLGIKSVIHPLSDIHFLYGQVMKVGLSCYLVLLSKPGNKTGPPLWPDAYNIVQGKHYATCDECYMDRNRKLFMICKGSNG